MVSRWRDTKVTLSLRARAKQPKLCAEHNVILGGESPLHAVEIGSASLGKGVHREVESEGS